jgi:hypothetical protein
MLRPSGFNDEAPEFRSRFDRRSDLFHDFDARVFGDVDRDRIDVLRHLADRVVDFRFAQSPAAAEFRHGFAAAAAYETRDLETPHLLDRGRLKTGDEAEFHFFSKTGIAIPVMASEFPTGLCPQAPCG